MKNNKIIIIASVILVLALISLTIAGSYAFYTVNLKQNGDSGISASTANLKLEFTDGDVISPTYFIPGSSYTKKFTVQNTGNKAVSFKIVIKEVVNNFVNKNDLKIEIKENGNTIKNNITFPSSTTALSDKITINPNSSAKNYEVIITYKNTDNPQEGDMGKNISGVIFIEAA